MSKNAAAVALGRLAKGVKKTGLTAAERKRRSEQARRNLAAINARPRTWSRAKTKRGGGK